MIVGITGRYCAGKSSWASLLGSQGYAIIDTDKVGHAALEKNAEEIIRVFGNTIVHAHDKRINRKLLGEIVFSDKTKLAILERITHPYITQQIIDKIAHDTTRKIVIDAALLHYIELHTLCDLVLIVHTPWIIRFFRARTRDALSLKQTFARLRHYPHVPDKHNLTITKKTLNLSPFYSEQIVSGSCSDEVKEKLLLEIFEGVQNGTTAT